jgi:hypothetical protein
MNSIYKTYIFLCVGFLCSFGASGQGETAKWKLQIALGVNHPLPSGFADGIFAQSINLPTVNIGIQHMFARELGAKIDIGFNRFKSGDGSPEFKTNYTRLNVHLVYDPTPRLHFLPSAMRVVLHGGPGISFVQPLGEVGQNKLTYLNALIGGEIHYGISETLSIYAGGAYVLGFYSKDLNSLSANGLGAFGGNLMYATIGLSVSLSGCYYCD